ncbi:hypothetical protein [Nocardioides marinquilinus]|uniref:hypothetical protein n=1 Tax=Nocardioides marinquilinus TaxID=1210400 RepID=UPI0031EBE7B7
MRPDSPFRFPPGPERREALTAEGWNVSDVDYTDEELDESRRRADAMFARMDARRRARGDAVDLA